jgi:tetratricopeptide (TPR) repeat protein
MGLPAVGDEKTVNPPSAAAPPHAAGRSEGGDEPFAEAMLAFAGLVRKIDPESALWVYRRNNLAKACGRWGESEDAVACWRAPLETRLFDTHTCRGLASVGLVEMDNALTSFEQAVAANPGSADARWNLGSCLLRQHKVPQAADQWREAVHLAPNDADMLVRLAWLLTTSPDPRVRNVAEAEELAGRAARLGGGRDPALLQTLRLLRDRAHRPEAALRSQKQN